MIPGIYSPLGWVGLAPGSPKSWIEPACPAYRSPQIQSGEHPGVYSTENAIYNILRKMGQK